MPDGFANADRDLTSCTHDGVVVKRFTSGWFSNIDILGVGGWSTNVGDYPTAPALGWPSEKCVHGSPFLFSSSISGFGLNKDTSLRSNHAAARLMAVVATASFVTNIIGRLGDDYKAIC